jgi:hypothetical protein
MNTPPANTSGINAPSGYKTSTDGMSSAAKTIHDTAEDAQGEVKDLKPTKMTDKEFGVKHTQWFGDYSKAIDALGAGADAMCGNLTAFAGELGGAGATYAATDNQNAQTVSNSGA